LRDGRERLSAFCASLIIKCSAKDKQTDAGARQSLVCIFIHPRNVAVIKFCKAHVCIQRDIK
jgi:hypothetical protein